MAIDSVPSETTSRRAILAGAVGGLAGLIAGRFAAPDRGRPRQPANLSSWVRRPTAPGRRTRRSRHRARAPSCSSPRPGPEPLSAARPSAQASIAGFFTANNGTGISGVTGNGAHYGVFGQNNGPAGSAGAIRANGGQNHGLVASTANNGKFAVSATGANGTAIHGSADPDRGRGRRLPRHIRQHGGRILCRRRRAWRRWHRYGQLRRPGRGQQRHWARGIRHQPRRLRHEFRGVRHDRCDHRQRERRSGRRQRRCGADEWRQGCLFLFGRHGRLG